MKTPIKIALGLAALAGGFVLYRRFAPSSSSAPAMPGNAGVAAPPVGSGAKVAPLGTAPTPPGVPPPRVPPAPAPLRPTVITSIGNLTRRDHRT